MTTIVCYACCAANRCNRRAPHVASSPIGPGWPKQFSSLRQQVTLDDHSEVVPPLPIPNRTVKHLCADDS